MIRAVIFDFNGILVDDEHLHFELFREVLAPEGIDLTEARYHEKYLGFDDRGCFEAVLTDFRKPADFATIEMLLAQKASRYADRAGTELVIFPGAVDCLAALAERWPVAICSGALRQEIVFALRLMQRGEQIAAIVAAEDTERCKPDPEGYLLALDALRSIVGEDLEAAHCLVVEDSLAGIEAAKTAGMWVVAVSNTYNETELRASGADAVIDGLAGLNPEWVNSFFIPEISP
jgi:HAD superfamily hydrolase (TIGR01509 family)